MNLDDLSAFAKLDPQNMIGQIDNLPDQLDEAWQIGQKQPLPEFPGLNKIVISGMGGSAIGADLIASFVSPQCSLPILVHRDYELPAYAQGPETLVITSSHSGNTEETLSSFKRAQAKGCSLIAVTTGGKLAELAQAAGVPVWHFEHAGQPRAAVGYSFGLLLSILYRLGAIADPTFDLEKTLLAMHQQQEIIKVGVPLGKNPAKRLASELYGHFVTVLGADFLAPVARRWKGQISEVAKAWAQFEFLPEADHNTLAGTVNPKNLLEKELKVLFLHASSDHPRNQLREELTRKVLIQQGINTDVIEAQGDNPMAQIWTTLHMGDYTAYYLAMAYGVDPTPVDALQSLKAALA